MTEEEVANLGESVPEGGGASVQPSTDGSPATEAQHSPDAESLAATLQSDPEFVSWIDKRFQSWKDKRLDKHETDIGNLKSGLADYRKVKEEIQAMKAKGFTEEQAEFLLERGTPAPQPQSPGTTSTVEAKDFDADAILRGQGIDPNSAEGVEIIRASNNANELIAKVIERKTKPAQEPSAASSMPDGTGASIGARDLAAVEEEMNKLSTKTGKTSADWAKLKEIRQEHANMLRT